MNAFLSSLPYLVGVSAAATAIVLFVGVFTMGAGSEFHDKYSNVMMRWSNWRQPADDKQGDTLEKVVDGFEDSVNALISKVDAIEVDSGVFSDKFGAAAGTLQNVLEQIGQRSEAEQQAAAELQKLIGTLNELTGGQLQSNLQSAVAGIEGISQELQSASGSIREVHDSIGSIVEELSEARINSVEDVQLMVQRLSESVELAQASTREIQIGLLDTVRALRSEVQQ